MKATSTKTAKRLFANVPYLKWKERFPYMLEHRINPEIYLPADALDTLVPAELARVAEQLRDNGLSCTIHSVYMDLNPGSQERMIRKVTGERYEQVMDAAEVLKPQCMVFHSGFDRWRYSDAVNVDFWIRESAASWRRLLKRAEGIGTVIAIENIFEEEPSTLKALFDEVDDASFGHCLDIGHWNLFKSVDMPRWFEALGERILEVHIHDNSGTRDDHFPPGEGAIDFREFFQLMERYAPGAAYTIEAHNLEHLQRSLAALAQYLG